MWIGLACSWHHRSPVFTRMTRLSVNVNKVAVLRNSRGGNEPSVVRAAEVCIEAGAHGITVHPRPDQRHIRHGDVRTLATLCRGRAEFNIEGNPFAPAREGYPGLLEMVIATRPDQVTLVPDADAQLTSDHGFQPPGDIEQLGEVLPALRRHAGRVSVFVDPGRTDFTALAALGVARIEIYTGPFALAYNRGSCTEELEACVRTSAAARAVGLDINAGHDLDQSNLPQLRNAIPYLAEVSIGHALFGEALYAGLVPTVRAYLGLLADTSH